MQKYLNEKVKIIFYRMIKKKKNENIFLKTTYYYT